MWELALTPESHGDSKQQDIDQQVDVHLVFLGRELKRDLKIPETLSNEYDNVAHVLTK